MKDCFEKLMDILNKLFTVNQGISEEDYHRLVQCMWDIRPSDGKLSDKNKEVVKRVFRIKNYNPFDHMENIRFAFTFGSTFDTVTGDIDDLEKLIFANRSTPV